MSKKGMLIIDVVLAFCLLMFDQYTKLLTLQNLKGNPAKVLIDGVLELQYLENRGSAFGLLENQKFIILAIGFIFMAIIFYILYKLPQDKKFRAVHILLTMIVAGGIGNMIDRFRFDFVVDFISFVLINYPIFNVADIYIVVATFILFFLFVFVFKEEDFAFLKKSTGNQEKN